MPEFFVTYGNGTNLKNNFSKVEAEDYTKARQLIHGQTGGKYAFCYSEAEFKGQAEKYGLTEAPLQPQKYI